MSERGFVNEPDMKAIVRLKLYSGGQEVFMNVEIDTGAGLELVVPSSAAGIIGIELGDNRTAQLADGSMIVTREGLAELDWLGEKRIVIGVIFYEAGDFAPLDARRHAGRAHGRLGRNLLRDAKLTIDYPNRSVTVEPLFGRN